MTDELSPTQVPLQLHPANFTRVHEDYQADPVVLGLKEALSVADASWRATLVGHRKVMSDPMHTPEANLDRSAKAAYRRQDEALKRLDGAVQRCARELQMIDEALNKPADPPPPHLVRLVADRLAGMKPDDRRKIIGNALQADDAATINSVLYGAPAWVFGMSNEERDLYKSQYQRTKYPAAVARKAELEKAAGIATAGGQALFEAVGKLIDRKRLDSATALAQAAEAALG
jgi:hypothetical protein